MSLLGTLQTPSNLDSKSESKLKNKDTAELTLIY